MKDKQLLGSYKNGNYNIAIYSDGTKIRETEGDAFIPSFAENINLKITEKSDPACPWYHSIVKEGENQAALMAENEIETVHKYIKSLRPFTEVTISGNDLSNPEILDLLVYLRKKRVISNILISQENFVNNYHRILGWTERRLIRGLEVSLEDSEDSEFLQKIQCFDRPTIHIMSGVFTGDDLDNLDGKNLRIFVHGFNKDLLPDDLDLDQQDIVYNEEWLSEAIKTEFPDAFSSVSFDNLAIEQLHVKETLSKDSKDPWDDFYIRPEEDFDLCIDAVNDVFYSNSGQSEKRPIEDKLADKMFRELRKRLGRHENKPKVK